MRSLLFPLQLIAIVGLLSGYYIVPAGVSNWIIWACLAIFYIYAWTAISTPVVIKQGIPTFFNINVLFLIFYYILYYLPYQMHVLGFNTLYDPGPFMSSFPEQTNHAVLSATLGVVAFSLGLGQFSGLNRAVVVADNNDTRRYRNIDTAALVALVVLVALYLGAGWRTDGEGRYTGTASGGVIAEGISLIIIMLAMICISLFILEVSKGARPKLVNWLGLGVAGIWALRLLAAGDRNSFLLLALTGLAGFFTYCRPVGRITIAVFLGVALTLYNAVEVVRMTGDLSIASIVQYLSQPAGASAQSSFNFTTISTRAAIYSVPDSFDYFHGLFKLVGFAGAIPLIRGMLLGDSSIFTSSAEVLTYVLLGPSATWSVGSNVLSDIYVDFGVVGIPVVIFLIGRFARTVQLGAIRNPLSPRSISLYLASLALIAEMPRYSVDFPVRILVWMALFFWLFRLVANQRAAKSVPGWQTMARQADVNSVTHLETR